MEVYKLKSFCTFNPILEGLSTTEIAYGATVFFDTPIVCDFSVSSESSSLDTYIRLEHQVLHPCGKEDVFVLPCDARADSDDISNVWINFTNCRAALGGFTQFSVDAVPSTFRLASRKSSCELKREMERDGFFSDRGTSVEPDISVIFDFSAAINAFYGTNDEESPGSTTRTSTPTSIKVELPQNRPRTGDGDPVTVVCAYTFFLTYVAGWTMYKRWRMNQQAVQRFARTQVEGLRRDQVERLRKLNSEYRLRHLCP
jgi:hypothetical protein